MIELFEPSLHEEGADDRGDDAGAADRQRIEHDVGDIRRRRRRIDRGQNHGGDDRHRIGLEKVGRHARAVADIVADIVGDGGRVARIVLGNTCLNLADEIAADIGTLGEDAAAETREDRDERGAEAERDQRVDDLAVGGAKPRPLGQHREVDRDRQERQASDEHARHRARSEGDRQGRRQGCRWPPAPCARWRAPTRACR